MKQRIIIMLLKFLFLKKILVNWDRLCIEDHTLSMIEFIDYFFVK